MSIDPYNDVEIYEVDIEDKIVEVITLTDTPKKKMEETSSQKVTNPPTQSITLTASTSKQENIVVTLSLRILSRTMLWKKMKEQIRIKQCPYQAHPWQIMTETKLRI